MLEWTARPHVSEWWDSEETADDDARDFKAYIAYLGDEPIAYVQSYLAIDAGDGWWADQHDPTVIGMDLFIGDEENVGRGYGVELVRQFVDHVFADPTITRIQIDPSPDNLRAIRCYERVGFHRVRTVDTPDGPELLMHFDRKP